MAVIALARFERQFRLLDLDYADDTKARFPAIIGGLSVALARSFKILDPGLKNPKPEHWQRSFDLFDLLL